MPGIAEWLRAVPHGFEAGGVALPRTRVVGAAGDVGDDDAPPQVEHGPSTTGIVGIVGFEQLQVHDGVEQLRHDERHQPLRSITQGHAQPQREAGNGGMDLDPEAELLVATTDRWRSIRWITPSITALSKHRVIGGCFALTKARISGWFRCGRAMRG